MTFQDWLISALDRRNMTPMELSVELDLPEGRVQSWSMGFSEPTPVEAVTVAEVLDEDPATALATLEST